MRDETGGEWQRLDERFEFDWPTGESQPVSSATPAPQKSAVSSSEMPLLPGETVLRQLTFISSVGAGVLALTTHRLRYRVGSENNMRHISIMLEELASTGLSRSANPALLILAAVLGILLVGAGAVSKSAMLSFAGIVIAAVLVALYFSSQRTVLVFRSAGATIEHGVTRMKVEDALQFVEATDAAKNERYLGLTASKGT